MSLSESIEEFVSERRFLISVIFPAVGAVMFLGSAEGILPDILSFNPLLILAGVFVMRLPLVAGLVPVTDRDATVALLAVSLYAYIIEFVGLKTGWPYGEFLYEIPLGPMVSGVPIGLPLFFVPLVLNAFLLATLSGFTSIRNRLPATVAAVLLVDLALDPAAVSLGVWSYTDGVFHGVPLSNFAGWILSASISTLIIEAGFRNIDLESRLLETDYMLDDLVSFQFLWGSINLYYGNIIPVVSVLALSLALWRTEKFSFAFEKS